MGDGSCTSLMAMLGQTGVPPDSTEATLGLEGKTLQASTGAGMVLGTIG